MKRSFAWECVSLGAKVVALCWFFLYGVGSPQEEMMIIWKVQFDKVEDVWSVYSPSETVSYCFAASESAYAVCTAMNVLRDFHVFTWMENKL